MDLNPNTLDFASNRISRYKPETYSHNVFDPIHTNIRPFNNKKGIFANTADDLESLEVALNQRFDNVNIELIGCVALFSGRRP